jgi:hypothetical protein
MIININLPLHLNVFGCFFLKWLKINSNFLFIFTLKMITFFTYIQVFLVKQFNNTTI